MALTDGKPTAPSPFAISALLVIGGIVWAVQWVAHEAMDLFHYITAVLF